MRARFVFNVCLIVAGLLVALIAGRRALQMMAYPIGTSDSKKSPDGRYQAVVTAWYEESFLGHPKRWFEFEVRDGSSLRLITEPIAGPSFGSRSRNSVIDWADDSSVVTFVFPATEIRMKP